MATFAVVNFTTENAVEVVPVSWLTNNDEDCRWPPYRPGQASAAIRNMESPHATWTVCKCRVLYTTGTVYILCVQCTFDFKLDYVLLCGHELVHWYRGSYTIGRSRIRIRARVHRSDSL